MKLQHSHRYCCLLLSIKLPQIYGNLEQQYINPQILPTAKYIELCITELSNFVNFTKLLFTPKFTVQFHMDSRTLKCRSKLCDIFSKLRLCIQGVDLEASQLVRNNY